MKKLLFQIIFLLLIIPAFSQGFVTVNGTVTDLANGNPIPNHAVTIMSDSSSGFVYYKVVMTNASGFFADTVIVTMGVTGILFIRTYDCNNILHQDELPMENRENDYNKSCTSDDVVCCLDHNMQWCDNQRTNEDSLHGRL